MNRGRAIVNRLRNPLGTPVPEWARRHLPGTSRVWGPPRSGAWIEDYVKRRTCKWIEVVPRMAIMLPAPIHSEADRPEYRYIAKEHPAAGVLELPRGRVLGSHGWAVTRDDTFLYDTNHWFWSPTQTQVFNLNSLRGWGPVKRLAGTVVNLLSFHAQGNYYHLLLEVMPKIFLLEEAGYDWRGCDHILFPKTNLKSSVEVISRVGLPWEKVRFVESHEQIEADLLIQPSQPGAPHVPPAWAVAFLRRRLGRPPSGHERSARWSMLRAGMRRGAENGSELRAFLQARSFKEFQHDENDDEAAAMACAEAVVGEHGAALARIVFCPPGTSMVELLPRRGNYTYYRALAHAGGLRYGVVAADGGQGKDSAVSYSVTKLDEVLHRCGIEEMPQSSGG